MFYCQATKVLVPAGETANKLVTHVREKIYYRKDKYGQDVIAGRGQEIVREILVSREYYTQLMAKGFQPEVVHEKKSTW